MSDGTRQAATRTLDDFPSQVQYMYYTAYLSQNEHATNKIQHREKSRQVGPLL